MVLRFGHEQLDVYRLAVDYVAWSHALAKGLKGVDRHARDQLLRAAQSIPLNVAEGNGKGTNADRRRFFETARGSAYEVHDYDDNDNEEEGEPQPDASHGPGTAGAEPGQ